MNGKIINARFIFITITILLATFSRLLPHPPNFAPITAIALLGGALYTDRKMAFIVPFAAMLLSDVIIGFHNTMGSVYMAFGLIVIIGFTLRNNMKISSVILASLASSILFFLITNFSVWYGSTFYPQNISGLLASYYSAIPFYGNNFFGSFFMNTIMGDLFYSALLFGLYYIAQLNFPQLKPIPVKSK